MPLPQKKLFRRPLDGALAAVLWFDCSPQQAEALRSLLDAASWPRALSPDDSGLVREAPRSSPAETLLRQAVLLTPPAVRPYFAVCALEAWRRVTVHQLAVWSGIPLSYLKRHLASRSLTPAGVAAWNLALHATWLLDVAEVPASAVVGSMQLGRPAGLAAVLGARAVRFCAGRVESGAFATTLDRYLAVLRAAFRV